ncbi:MAG: DUF1203 domain-containing protein [Candidatus Eremiobacteraeota bacterium]|nr:DUF1203 domain-containing protein [Candidatus Eremiobacteraeota bacterium]
MSRTLSAAMQFVPIEKEIAEEARRTLRDRFGHNLCVQNTAAPCISCLRISPAPEALILLSYRPLADINPYAEIGPIFIHAQACQPYELLHVFPEDFLPRSLILRAYDYAGAIVDACISEPGNAEFHAGDFLKEPTVSEVHVRALTYTCFDFKITRAI